MDRARGKTSQSTRQIHGQIWKKDEMNRNQKETNSINEINRDAFERNSTSPIDTSDVWPSTTNSRLKQIIVKPGEMPKKKSKRDNS